MLSITFGFIIALNVSLLEFVLIYKYCMKKKKENNKPSNYFTRIKK